MRPLALVSLFWLAAASDAPVLTDVAKKAGIDIVVRTGGDKKYLPELITGGLCLLDFDNDGRQDLYVVNGVPGSNHLYRNRGDGTFDNVTARAGVSGHQVRGMGCAAADYDNDGFTDLYVTNFGPSVLYRNRGDGTFADVSGPSHTGHDGWSTGAAWGDFDNDGWLDLYVARYVVYDWHRRPAPGSGDHCKFVTLDVACGPGGLTPATHVFYHNQRDGTFRDETVARGLAAPAAFGLGVCTSDYDNDGDLDLFVANDSMSNFLFRNEGNGTFREVALESGVALNDDGNAQACMGVDIADYDNDGKSDIVVTNFANDTNTIYRNDGKGQFRDVSTFAGQRDSYPYMGWGVGFVDLDNDGRKDLYVVNGHLYPEVDGLGNPVGYKQRDLLYRNAGRGRFTPLHSTLTHPKHVGRGTAFGDLDNDGRLDIVISNIDDPPNVLLNRSSRTNHYLVVRTIGASSNRDGIGARLYMTTDAGVQMAEVRSGCSYLSSSDRRVHFGLGASTRAATLLVRWPGGRTTVLRDVPADQILIVREGESTSLRR